MRASLQIKRARRRRPRQQQRWAASARRSDTGTTGSSAAKASPWATLAASRTPVKAPGPRPKAIASSWRSVTASLAEQLLDHRQDVLAVAAARSSVARRELAVDQQRRRAALGRGIEREHPHSG